MARGEASEEEIRAVERELADTLDLGDGRVQVPLRMIAGNMQILLDRTIFCEGVSLKWDETAHNAVILTFHFSPEQKKLLKEIGFQTRSVNVLGEEIPDE